MLIREKNLKDEYRELIEAEQAKKEADLKALTEAAKAAKMAKPKKAKKVGGLKTKKNKK